MSVTAPEGLNVSSVSGINSDNLLAFDCESLSSKYSINLGTCSLVLGLGTGSPSHNTNFFNVISGVENVRECVDMYSSVAALPLKAFIRMIICHILNFKV